MCSAGLVGPPTLSTRKRDGLMTTGIALRGQAGRAVASLAATAALLVLGGTNNQAPAEASPAGSLASPTAAQTRDELDRRVDFALGDWLAPSATSASRSAMIGIGQRACVCT